MPYKRKAHVLFVAEGDVARALLALAAARELASDWIEAQAVVLAPAALPAWLQAALAEAAVPAGPVLSDLNPALRDWADLLVSLDDAAHAACARWAPDLPCRHYPYAAPQDRVAFEALRAGLRQRIAGMAGGMRMLARSG